MSPNEKTTLWISWILRVGVVMEFVGHGALGVGKVAAWSSYFAVVGISKATAMTLMPLVGAFDVTMALTVLFFPMRAVILYMAFWGLWTALLRPLAGESSWEAVERAGNFGALTALFLLARGGGWKSWFHFQRVTEINGTLERPLAWTLRVTTVLLLAGHGALGFFVHKTAFGLEYAALGIHAPWVESFVGALEIGLAVAVLARPGFGLLVAVVVWKLLSEALAPMAGSSLWVFIEHGGSYAAPLALAILVRHRGAAATTSLRRSPA